MYWTRREMLKATALGLMGKSILGWAESTPAHASTSHPALIDVPNIDESDYQARLAKAKELMTQRKIDALLITGGSSLYYFGGFNWHRSERLFAMIIPRKGTPVFVCPAFEEQRVQELINSDYKIYTWQEHESPYQLIKRIFAEFKIATGRIGIEETVRFFEMNGIAKAASSLILVSGDPVTIGCRSIKSKKELEIMHKANEITVQAYEAGLIKLRQGMNENDTAKIVSEEFRKIGVQGGVFVLHGENSAYPHGTKNKQPLKEGMIVLMDGGCKLNGYSSDITRTIVFGEPTEKQLKIWDIVRKAQDKALEAAKVGVPCGEVDTAARKVIVQAGFGPEYKYFTHRLGHGIGLDGHEWPYLVKGNSLPLTPGMTFSDEPGIYLYGEFGIRLEDIMYIDEEGGKLFTKQSLSLTQPFN
ncbi:MAG: M24 family metallopeptidase [bacterium]